MHMHIKVHYIIWTVVLLTVQKSIFNICFKKFTFIHFAEAFIQIDVQLKKWGSLQLGINIIPTVQ